MSYSAAQDLADALIQQLVRSPCAGLFGDTWDPSTQNGVPKFYAEYAGDVAQPYLVFMEVGEAYTFMTPGIGNNRPFLADGQIQAMIFAPDRYQARTLGVAVYQALNDADVNGMVWNGGRLVALRMMQASFVPIPQTGPGSVSIFSRAIMFQYQWQGGI